MQFRKLSSGFDQVSVLGFGCMRFPTVDGKRNSPHIDEAVARQLLEYAIEKGVNYLDTAYVYHEGESERFLGRALSGGLRNRVKLATKLPMGFVRETADFDRILHEQLERLRTDHLDYYLFHALNGTAWREQVLRYGLLEKAAQAIEDGRIGQLGFSFHGSYDEFAEILNGSELWTFCQIQYNYMDVENQAGRRGLQLAADRGLGVVVMEPLLGGRLADPPREVLELMQGFPLERTPVEWALGWLWDQPEVSVVLSGMDHVSQLEENLRLAARAREHCFGSKEQTLIAEVRACYTARGVVPCTKCGYCLPCPSGVNIPGCFEIYNYAKIYNDLTGAQVRYGYQLAAGERAASCMACGKCEAKCPQQIEIYRWLQEVDKLLEDAR